MNNIIKLLQEIFMGKEDNSARVGLTFFRDEDNTPVSKQVKRSSKAPQELKLSELMKKSY